MGILLYRATYSIEIVGTLNFNIKRTLGISKDGNSLFFLDLFLVLVVLGKDVGINLGTYNLFKQLGRYLYIVALTLIQWSLKKHDTQESNLSTIESPVKGQDF